MAARKKTTTVPEAALAPVITSYKGFDKDWSCRGHKFEIGKTYTVGGPIKACSHGFHACENPFDVLSYYPLTTSVFAEVEQSGDISRHGDDSKIASASITIKAELSLPSFIKRAVAWVVDNAKTNLATGDSGHAAATGYSGHAAATGYRGHAAATGNSGHAAATGNRGHAAATGNSGHAAATGDSGHAAATGYSGHAAATGYRGHAAATGYSGHAAATGYSGHAAATGYRGHAAATGDSGHAAATGYRGHAAATGDSGHAAATGYRGHAAATGNSGHAAATGEFGIAVSVGYGARAKAGINGAISITCISEQDYRTILAIRSSKVGENGIKPNVWYSLSKDGEFVECEVVS